MRHSLRCNPGVLAAVAAVFLCSCAVSPLRAPLLLESGGPLLTGEDLRPFRGSAVIDTRIDKQTVRGRVEGVWRSDREFSWYFYDPFGTLVGWATADSNGVRAGFGDSTWTAGLSGPLTIPGMVDGRFFTFRQFVRILTGRFPFGMPDGADVDSISPEGRRVVLHLRTDSMLVELVTCRRMTRVLEIRCAGRGNDAWRVVYSDFVDSRPRRIEVVTRAGSFVLRYDRIILLSDSENRLALRPDRAETIACVAAVRKSAGL